MYRWLAACIVSTVVATGSLSIAWWATCSFYISPQIIRVQTEQEQLKEPESCRNSGERAVATLTGLLATLLGVAGQFDRKE